MLSATRWGAGCVRRTVRLCRVCAQKLDLWEEWKGNHYLYDHHTSMPCDECDGANLRNPETIFTVKLRLPNSDVRIAPASDLAVRDVPLP